MSNEKIADWMADKLTRLARGKAVRENCLPADALNVLCGEALQTLEGELTAFPELSQVLPHGLGKNLRAGAFGALSALELAAIVIVDTDAQVVAAVAGPENLVEFTELKLKALGNLLIWGLQ